MAKDYVVTDGATLYEIRNLPDFLQQLKTDREKVKSLILSIRKNIAGLQNTAKVLEQTFPEEWANVNKEFSVSFG